MNTKLIYLLLLSFLYSSSFAQKVLSYPFKFENNRFVGSDNDTYFLVDKTMDNVAIVMHDIQKADFIMTDRNLKVLQKFTLPAKNIIFGKYNKGTDYSEEYVGGSGSNSTGIFNLVYTIAHNNNTSKQFYLIQTVNFNNQTVTEKDFISRTNKEKPIVSFTDYGAFYCMNANDETGEFVIHSLMPNGETATKNIPFKIPAGKGKKRNSLSEYLNGTKLVKEDEEAELETATQSSKLFSDAANLIFIINDNSSPTHIVKIDKKSLTLTESFIDHSSLFAGEEKEKSYVNSFLSGDKIFSLALNKKNIQVAIYSLQDGKLLKKHDITEDNYEKNLNSLPMYHERKGSKEEDDDIEDYKHLVKALTKGTEGVLVTKNALGQYILTIGTYDHINVSTGGGGGYSTTMSTVGSAGATQLGSVYVATTYTPGLSGFTSGGSNYYKTTSFKLLLDPNTLNPLKGKIKATAGDQIKDFMDGRSHRIRKQFAIGDKQYFGYSDKDTETYIIENIPLRK